MANKRFVSLFLSLLMLLDCCLSGAGAALRTDAGRNAADGTFSAFPERSLTESQVLSGNCGDNLTWTLGSAGTLTISGFGAMDDYWNPVGYHFAVFIPGVTDAPWYYVRDDILHVTIQEGAASIGVAAFSFCESLRSVTIPSTVKKIGASAFYHCPSLRDVYFAGSESDWNSILETSDPALLSAQIHYAQKRVTVTFVAGENALIQTPGGGLAATY